MTRTIKQYWCDDSRWHTGDELRYLCDIRPVWFGETETYDYKVRYVTL